MLNTLVTVVGVACLVASTAWAGQISGSPVRTVIQTETQSILLDQEPTLLVAPLNLKCKQRCALKITLTAALDIMEPETTIYGEALINGQGTGVTPYDLVPLVQNIPFGLYRLPLTWTWVTEARLPQEQRVEVALFTNGKSVQVHSRTVTIEVLRLEEE